MLTPRILFPPWHRPKYGGWAWSSGEQWGFENWFGAGAGGPRPALAEPAADARFGAISLLTASTQVVGSWHACGNATWRSASGAAGTGSSNASADTGSNASSSAGPEDEADTRQCAQHRAFFVEYSGYAPLARHDWIWSEARPAQKPAPAPAPAPALFAPRSAQRAHF